MSRTPPKVFISYTHDSSAHNAAVLELANRLRQNGFDVDIDQYHANQDWPAWMERSIAEATYVLVVCTATYQRRWENKEAAGIGLGAQWESLLTRQHLYFSPGLNAKFIPVVFSSEDVDFIPVPLSNVTRVLISGTTGFDSLLRRLLNIPPAVKPPVLTPLAPIKLAPDFFGATRAEKTRPAPSSAAKAKHMPGLLQAEEFFFPNLFRISFPKVIHCAKVRFKKSSSLDSQIETIRARSKDPTPPPYDFIVDGGLLYSFRDLHSGIWSELRKGRSLTPQPSLLSHKWACTKVPAEASLFTKLLNRSFTHLCRQPGMNQTLNWSKQMRCWLFAARAGSDSGTLKVRAIKVDASREVYKAIYTEHNGERKLQHWKHQAFRHKFRRFGGEWFIEITPFWAFTSDGTSGPSRWQKQSSANMTRPERNRAVLGHVMFWASVLCRDPDLFRDDTQFRVDRPVMLSAAPSINDDVWMDFAHADERETIQTDARLLL